VSHYFGRFEGDLVVQLFNKDMLLDENIITIIAGTPRRISLVEKTGSSLHKTAAGMINIPAGKFIFHESHGDEFIPYPRQDVDSNFQIPSFYMDRYPVTNRQFREFLLATHYKPADTLRFLAHWINGQIPKGLEQYPVVNISYEDAKAYAHWAGKRLPTEIEWQYAAQTDALNEWPWIQTVPVKRKEEVVTETLTITSLEGIDSMRCNLGDGHLYAVGKYQAGTNPYGLGDLVGSVWQLTNDEYMNGSYRYIIMKGGSYYKPSGSWWYVQGGPRELHYRQFLLRVSQGFERNATVGFRCVRDIR
jgi:formylglycine-generating enzyme required for sulfatase activity